MDHLIEVERKLGLEGEDLTSFVIEQQGIKRKERQREREKELKRALCILYSGSFVQTGSERFLANGIRAVC